MTRLAHRLMAIFLLLLLTANATGACAASSEHEQRRARAIADARRNVEASRLRLRLYERVEHPRKQRELDAAIALTKAEVAKFRELLAEYTQISRRTVPEPLIVSRQTAELALLAAELKLADLAEERQLQMRYYSDQCRLYQLEVEAASAHLRDLLEAE